LPGPPAILVAMAELVVAVVQEPGHGLDVSANCVAAAAACRVAAAQGADVVVLPELWQIAYSVDDDGWLELATPIDGPYVAEFRRLARELGIAILVTFLEQTEEDIVRFKTRLEHIDEPRLRRLVISDIKRLKARKAAHTRLIAKLLRAYDDLAKRLDLVLSIPGIGERTALAIIIRMPELGQISREEAAAWLRTATLLPAEAGLSNSEHAALLRLRDSIRDVLAAYTDGRQDEAAAPPDSATRCG